MMQTESVLNFLESFLNKWWLLAISFLFLLFLIRKYIRRKKYRYRRQEYYNPANPKDQISLVEKVGFKPMSILNKSEYNVLKILESVVKNVDRGYRVMAQTSMGEIITTDSSTASKQLCDLAYRSVNSKRLDFLVIDCYGWPALAIEYQGSGHHHRSDAFIRDAVKRRALEKAGIEFFEIKSGYDEVEVRDQLRSRLEKHFQANVAR